MFARHWLIYGTLLVTSSAACKGSDSKAADPQETAAQLEENEKISESEDALLSKRDALFNMRRNLQDKRAELVAQRAEIEESGGDPSQLDDKARALLSEEKELVDQEQALNQRMQEITAQRRQIMAALTAGGGGGDIAGREAGMASREKTLARREKEIAEREAALAKREEGLAGKWKDGCALATPQTIIRTVDVKGSNYTKKDIEPLLAKARKDMSRKGLLASDLPEQARGLEDEANDAMKAGDYGRARLAASQLVGTVRSTKIDKGFIASKIQRLNGRMRGKTLSNQTENLFREATALYGDADFSKANGKLNQIYASLR